MANSIRIFRYCNSDGNILQLDEYVNQYTGIDLETAILTYSQVTSYQYPKLKQMNQNASVSILQELVNLNLSLMYNSVSGFQYHGWNLQETILSLIMLFNDVKHNTLSELK
ncbi:Hypothetical_protein [Hexamita inflata]|uniref:Hypothetical_protein n=1 Tax=Hexamita inflata TaxID=28002 RepID=A0AA86PXB8_9EUKA|nr:Hypothetical protein HINF_LOCUS33522 [Hexamita inflata]